MKRLIIGSLIGLFLIALLFFILSPRWWPRGEVSGRQSSAVVQSSTPSLPLKGEGKTGSISLTSLERERLGLKTVRVEERALQEVFTVNGVIRAIPNRVASVSSRVEGRILKVLGNVGEIVRPGQILAELNSREVERLQTELLRARDRLALAEADLERIRYLVEKGIGAKKDLLQKEAEVKSTRKEIEGLENQLRLLGLEGDGRPQVEGGLPISLAVKAPIGGVILSKEVTVGEVVPAGRILFKIGNLERVLAEGEAFETHAASLREGLPVKVQVPAYPNRIFWGRIVGIGYEVEPETRTLRFWAELENRGLHLKPNMSAQLTVIVGRQGKVLAVPLEALIQEGGEAFVFMEEEGRYRRVPVSLGLKDDRSAEVKGGLKAGDVVVTTGKRQLYTILRLGRSGGELREMGSVD